MVSGLRKLKTQKFYHLVAAFLVKFIYVHPLFIDLYFAADQLFSLYCQLLHIPSYPVAVVVVEYPEHKYIRIILQLFLAVVYC